MLKNNALNSGYNSNKMAIIGIGFNIFDFYDG